MRYSSKFKNVFPPAVHISGYPTIWAQKLGYPNIWTAGGKTFLNSLEYLTKYLLAFLAPNYLSNSQGYAFMKFTSHQVSKIGQKLAILRNRR